MNNVIGIDRKVPKVGDSFSKFRKDVLMNPISSSEFVKRVKLHLVDYKTGTLKVSENGDWHGTPYQHILPKLKSDLNLIEFNQSNILSLPHSSKIKFHEGFSHLNSSQAMCMNFFYPLIINNALDDISKIMQISGKVNQSQFEKDSHIETGDYRKTNFDFYFKTDLKDVYFEIKYTESEFGGATRDQEHHDKFIKVYESHLINNPAFLMDIDEDLFMRNYQILRNFIILKPSNYVVFIYPKDNHIVRNSILTAKNKFISDSFYDQVILFTWEDLLLEISELEHKYHLLYSDFILKYLNY